MSPYVPEVELSLLKSEFLFFNCQTSPFFRNTGGVVLLLYADNKAILLFFPNITQFFPTDLFLIARMPVSFFNSANHAFSVNCLAEQLVKLLDL